MVVVNSKHLDEAATKYKDTARELASWLKIVQEARWSSFPELKSQITDADAVDGYVNFNIRHNRYRLVTVLHYSTTVAVRVTSGHCYIRSFLTHAEYDNRANWDRRFGN